MNKKKLNTPESIILAERFAEEIVQGLRVKTKLPGIHVRLSVPFFGPMEPLRIRISDTNYICTIVEIYILKDVGDEKYLHIRLELSYNGFFKRDRKTNTQFEGSLDSFDQLAEKVEDVLWTIQDRLRPEYLKSPLDLLTEDYSED